MKKIMILGGGVNQVPLIKKAKELGLYVVICSNKNNVPGIALSDGYYQVDAINPELLIKVGKKRDQMVF